MKETLITKKAPAPIGPYSQAIKANGFIFISGQICIDPETGNLRNASIKEEAEQVMKNLGAILEASKSSFDLVVKATIFLHDMNDFSVVNGIYGSYFKNNPPARETVEVSQLPKGSKVEISFIAIEQKPF